MATVLLPTSEIPFHSTTHGALRRTQRNISKRDLQSAVKYGLREQGRYHTTWGDTWKISWMNIVYITNDAMDTEITSWVDALPLEVVSISKRMQQKYDEAKKRLATDPWSATSHTVFVVDKSASMLTSDVDGHLTRARGAYYLLAEEYMSSCLHPLDCDTLGGDNMRYTDVVSLVEMRDGATIIFEREPISWIMYNKFVELAAASDNKYNKGCAGGCRGHGNYFESVDAALKLLSTHAHEKLGLQLHFLTDGKPSDKVTRSKRHANKFPNDLLRRLRNFSALYQKQFTMEVFGLGTDSFDVLVQMVDAVNASGASAKFGRGGRDLIALCNSLTSVVSSTTSVTSMLSRLNFKKEDRVAAAVDREVYDPSALFNQAHWDIYKPEVTMNLRSTRKVTCDRFVIVDVKSGGRWRPEWKQQALVCATAVGFAVKKKIFGEGAERIVYEMTEIDAAGNPVGEPLVAKDSKYLVKQGTQRGHFHKMFIATQSKAANLARKFNEALNRRQVDSMIPRIYFLPCSVYDCNTAPAAYLAEKRLNPQRYRKWNDNAGGIDGIARVNLAEAPLRAPALEAFAEGDEEDESDDDEFEEAEAEAEDGEGPKGGAEKSARVLKLEVKILDGDIVQVRRWPAWKCSRPPYGVSLPGNLTQHVP